jgi:hypothetical protein
MDTVSGFSVLTKIEELVYKKLNFFLKEDKMRLRVCCISVFSILFWTLTAVAAPITYIYTGTGSGTVGGTPFTDAAFTITAQADTDDLASCGGSCQEINHLSTSIVISGVGTYVFSSPLRTFLNNTPGLSRQDPPGGDLYSLQGNFSGWDLVSNWGPVNTTGSLIQWASPTVNTSGGVLVFPNQSTIPGTFQAILGQASTAIPTMNEWGMIIFMALAGLVAAYYLRRQRKAEI